MEPSLYLVRRASLLTHRVWERRLEKLLSSRLYVEKKAVQFHRTIGMERDVWAWSGITGAELVIRAILAGIALRPYAYHHTRSRPCCLA